MTFRAVRIWWILRAERTKAFTGALVGFASGVAAAAYLLGRYASKKERQRKLDDDREIAPEAHGTDQQMPAEEAEPHYVEEDRWEINVQKAASGEAITLQLFPYDTIRKLRWEVSDFLGTKNRVCTVRFAHNEQILKEKDVLSVIGLHSGSSLIAIVSDFSLLTASHDTTAKIWSASEGTCVNELTGHPQPLTYASFSRDGQLVATASIDSTIRIWDKDSGTCLSRIDTDGFALYTVVFSPTASSVLACGDTRAMEWSLQGVEAGQLIHSLVHPDMVSFAAYSPDGTSIATGCFDGQARIWDSNLFQHVGEVEEGELLAFPVGDSVNSVQFSPDGQFLATADSELAACVFDTEGTRRMAFEGHMNSPVFDDVNYVSCAAFSPDGESVVTAAADGTAKLFSVETGACRLTLRHNREIVQSVFSQDGHFIATACWDNTAYIWSVRSGECVRSLTGHTDKVISVDFAV